MKLKALVLNFLINYPGLYTVSDIASAIERPANTNLRNALALLVAEGKVNRQPVFSDNYRLAFGYALAEHAPKLL